jgi:hypothetical protein
VELFLLFNGSVKIGINYNASSIHQFEVEVLHFLGSLRIVTWSSQNRCNLDMHFSMYVHMIHLM